MGILTIRREALLPEKVLGDFLLGPNRTPENGIYTGDARELSLLLPDESGDLIFTDPVYEQVDDYAWLAETAARILKPDTACLAWGMTPLLPEYLRAMVPPLQWAWLMHWRRYGPCYPGRPGICVLTECMWLEKGHSRTYRKIADCKDAPQARSRRNSQHQWSKPEIVLLTWLEAFTKPGDVVIDFFAGDAPIPSVVKQLGDRYWLAFEIDARVADSGRLRVQNTQTSCFQSDPRQAKLI